MSPTGPKYPTVAVDGGGGAGIWTTPGNVYAVDAAYAQGDISGGGSDTNLLKSSGYGFSIPSTAVIDGIYVEFLRSGFQAATGGLSLMKAGAVVPAASKVGTDFWPASDAWVGYGAANDLWGTTWTPADINNSGFGFALGAYNTHGGGTAQVDAMRITVYWHTGPADVPKRYLYKIFSAGVFIGNLPYVKSEFGVSEDINTAGSQITVECAVSADTVEMPTQTLTDESGTALTDELDNPLTTDGNSPIVSPGAFTTNALIKNGNDIQVWEYSYYYPNGKCMFRGTIERWEADFGGTNGSDTIKLVAYSDGQDLDNYLVRGNPYTYTADIVQTSSNIGYTSNTSGMGAGWDRFGQTFTPAATNLGAINLALQGTANVTVNIYDNISQTTLLGSVTQFVNVASYTEISFALPTTLTTVPAVQLFFEVITDAGQSINIAASNANPYAGGQAYESIFGGGGGGAYSALAGNDMWFKTFSGTGSTTGAFPSQDPTVNMLDTFMDDYNARGGLITHRTETIEATGLSLTYTFNTNTINEALKAVLSMAPSGFYYTVDLGTNELTFKSTNTAADLVLTKGRHIDKLVLGATIENVKNQVFFTGGDTGGGANLYKTYQDPTSIGLYKPKLDRKTDNRVTVGATADAIGGSAVESQKDEGYQTTVGVLDKTMDITLLKPGLVVGFNGFGTFVDNLLLQIVRIDYTPEEVTLTLGALPKRLNSEFDRITRELLAQQTLANPSTPS